MKGSIIKDSRSQLLGESPLALIAVVLALVAIVDVFSAYIVLHFLPRISAVWHGATETIIVAVMLCPTLYYLLFQPLVLNVIRFRQAEEALRKANDELERRVQERTAEMETARGQLSTLVAHLRSEWEDERTDISRRIREELGQVLAALKMDLSLMQGKLIREDGTEELAKKMGAVIDLVDVPIQIVNEICADLRPTLLDYPGLGAAIEWEMEKVCGRSGIEYKVRLSPAGLVAEGRIATSLFRIAQEAIANVLQHAKATKVVATLAARDDTIMLEIADNGIGVTAEQLSKDNAFGLLEMYEWAHEWGGDVAIGGIPGEGTTVKVSIPIKSESGSPYNHTEVTGGPDLSQ